MRADTRSVPVGINNDPTRLRFDLAGTAGRVQLIPPSGSVIGHTDKPYLKVYAQFYAPGRLVETVGSGRVELFGSLVGNQVKVTAEDMLIHMPVNTNAGGGGSSSVNVLMWNSY